MDGLLSSPGMMAATAFVLVVQALSVLLLLLNIHLFRRQAEKYRELLRNLENEAACGHHGRFLLPIYIGTTFLATMAILYLFVFQPHIL